MTIQQQQAEILREMAKSKRLVTLTHEGTPQWHEAEAAALDAGAAALSRQREQDGRTLADYRPQHDVSCDSLTCKECGYHEGIHVNGYAMGYGSCADRVFKPRGSCSCGLDRLLAEFDAPGAQERTKEDQDHGAGLAAVGNDTGPSTTETARDRVIKQARQRVQAEWESSVENTTVAAIAAALEAVEIAERRLTNIYLCRLSEYHETWRKTGDKSDYEEGRMDASGHAVAIVQELKRQLRG